MTDELNPNHYRKGEVQPIDLIQSFNLPFELGNVVKYVCRYPDKGGVANLQKAIIYILLYAKRENVHEEVLKGCLKYYAEEIDPVTCVFEDYSGGMAK